MKVFARAGGEREQSPLGPALSLATRHLLEHRADGGVLVVAAIALAVVVALQERRGRGVGQRKAHPLLVARLQVLRRRELGELARSVGQSGEAIVLDELVAVAGKDELHVEPLGGSVELGLFEPVAGRLALRLRLRSAPPRPAGRRALV